TAFANSKDESMKKDKFKKKKSLKDKVAERVAEKTSEKKEMSAAKAKSSGKSKGGKKPKHETNEIGIRKGTVMETIYDCFNRKGGASKKEILAECVKRHPEREKDAMEKTINIQVYRMPQQRGFRLKLDKESHRYSIKERGLEPNKNATFGKAEGDEEK